MASPESQERATSVAESPVTEVDRWTYEVESPFRPPHEIRELATTGAGAVDRATEEAFSDESLSDESPSGELFGEALSSHEGLAGEELEPEGEAARFLGYMRRGSRGLAVEELQKSLNRNGASLKVDGIFGPATEAAVRAYQAGARLKVDGIVGPITWAHLEAPGVYLAGTPPATTGIGGGGSTGMSPDVPNVPLGTLILETPGQYFSYPFTREDLFWTAKVIVYEAGGTGRASEAVLWALFNHYAFFRHTRYPSFSRFVRAYSTTLQPVLNSWQAAARHYQNPSSQFVRTGGVYARAPHIPRGQLQRHLDIQRAPWSSVRESARTMALKALRGELPNPGIGNANEFASTKIFYAQHNRGATPDNAQWRAYTERYARLKNLRWIGDVPQLDQMKNAFFVTASIADVPVGAVRIQPPAGQASEAGPFGELLDEDQENEAGEWEYLEEAPAYEAWGEAGSTTGEVAGPVAELWQEDAIGEELEEDFESSDEAGEDEDLETGEFEEEGEELESGGYQGAGEFELGLYEGRGEGLGEELFEASASTSAPSVVACRPGEGPPAALPDPEGKGLHPLVYRSATTRRSRNPTVGHAQIQLNRFLDATRTGFDRCESRSAATVQFMTKLRARLRANGQDPLKVDCRFGDNTELATKMFQACHGLKPDGKIGPLTWPRLEAFTPSTPPAPPAPPTPPLSAPTMSFRPCCMLASGSLKDAATIGGHADMGGIIYTGKAGFVDFGHVRDVADLTAFAYQQIHAASGTAGTRVTTTEGHATLTSAVPAAQWLETARSIAFDDAMGHEIASYHSITPGGHNSGFSPEDLCSNFLGTVVAARALATGGNFSAEVERQSQTLLTSLDAQSLAETRAAFARIDGRWVVSGAAGILDPRYLRRRNFTRTPFKTGHPSDAPTPSFVTAAFALGSLPYDYQHTAVRTFARADFPTEISIIKTDARKRYGPDFDKP